MKKILVFFLFFSLISCRSNKIPTYFVIGGEKGMSLQSAEFADLKNFDNDLMIEADDMLQKNCRIIMAKPEIINQSVIKSESAEYVRICEKYVALNPKSSDDIRNFIRENFQPYKVLYDLNPQGKFTSYYEAEIKASKNKHGKYKFPIYGRPEDLIEINLQDFDKSLPKRRLVMRIDGQKAVPYLTREEIEKSGVKAPIVLWGDDEVDIYLMQIQGSAVAVLDDGTMQRVRYIDNNGHPFAGIGGILLKKGLLKPGEASMDKIRDWLKNNPALAKENMNENPRFIFHGLSEADGPIGAMGVTLTAGRSMAVDTQFIPLGSLLWLETTDPYGNPLEKLVAAQDIGGAIKGAVRGDYFWGHGEEALLSAGKMNSVGEYYILLPKGAKVEIRQ